MNPTRARSTRALSGIAALALSVGGAVGAFVVNAGPASADTITVTNTADDGTATSLRGVLESANAGDVVVLTAGATYQLTLCEEPVPVIKTTSVGAIDIGAAVTIEGNGAIIQQTCTDRVLLTSDEITLHDVTVTGGNVEGPGGGLLQDSSNPVTLNGATFTANTASDSGGGVATSGDISVTDSTFTDNHDTGGNGGGIKVFNDSGTATIAGSTFSGNTTAGWGGAFEQQAPNQSSAAATGDYVLNVSNSTIVGNDAGSDGAGGLDTEDPATITIDHTTVANNTSEGGGGLGAFGSLNTVSINASTFSGNVVSGGSGGAMIVDGQSDGTTVSIVNSTITGNSEGGFGAINVGGAVQLNHATITNNTSVGQSGEKAASSRSGARAQALGDDAANIFASSLTSFGSVVALPQGAGNCSSDTGTAAGAASVSIPSTDGGYNFSDDDTCGFIAATSNVKTPNDPVLGVLANNGGPTQTLLPLTGSPLLDAIPPAVCGSDVDQRGVSRPQGTGCDVGAVEVEVVAPAPAAVVTPKFTG